MMLPGILTGQPQQKTDTFSQLAEKAKNASEENRLDEAAALYGRALAMRPRWAEGWWSLGTIKYDQNHYAQAAHAFTRVVTLQPSNGTAHAMLGLCQYELSNYKSALRNLMAADRLGILKDEQLRKVAVYHLGLLQLRTRTFSAAKKTLGQLATDGVRSKDLSTALGMAALLVRPQEAPPEGTPGASVVQQAGDAEALLATNDFDGAKQIYNSLTTEYPDYPNLHFAFGMLLLETHEIDAAVAEFRREIQNHPRHVLARLEIAAVRYRLDSADGVKYAEEAVKLDPQRPFGHYLLGLLYLDTGNFSAAIPQLETARRTAPNLPEIYFALGNAYARAGRKEEAAQARAVFLRLQAQKKNEPRPSIYGQESTGVPPEKLAPPGKEDFRKQP
jgi:tetratricopeptide (TPR) repeat protein